jgi:hypothetical protein
MPTNSCIICNHTTRSLPLELSGALTLGRSNAAQWFTVDLLRAMDGAQRQRIGRQMRITKVRHLNK